MFAKDSGDFTPTVALLRWHTRGEIVGGSCQSKPRSRTWIRGSDAANPRRNSILRNLPASVRDRDYFLATAVFKHRSPPQTRSGTFRPLPYLATDPFVSLWAQKVFALLLCEAKIMEDEMAILHSWQHTGFSVDQGVRREVVE